MGVQEYFARQMTRGAEQRWHGGVRMFPVPTRIFLTKGVGVHRHPLTAFEFALRDADIEQQNLVTVSSILPAHCQFT
ncbi:hypothetical protein JQN09_24680, partial [Phocaeicola dorei]|uniref:pyruvoyl-dependent arginine decarboxylase n=1 Tax=Phocaeicola dorei TaxID=357276 RepID=UPI001BDE6451